jgi:hypothetical protein
MAGAPSWLQSPQFEEYLMVKVQFGGFGYKPGLAGWQTTAQVLNFILNGSIQCAKANPSEPC